MSGTVEKIPFPVVIILCLITFTGFLCNLLVLYLIIKSKHLQSVSSILICNLAISDILFAGLAVPLHLASLVNSDEWKLGMVGCKLVNFLPLLNIATSIYTMVAISHERRTAITSFKPKIFSKNQTMVTIAIIWMLGFFVTAPQLYEYSTYRKYESVSDDSGEISEEQDGNNGTMITLCGSHGIEEMFEVIYSVIVFLVSYLLPLFIILGNYIVVGRFIWKRSCQTAELNNGTISTAVSKSKIKVLKMCIVVTTVFAIFWAPFFSIFVREEVLNLDNSASAGSIANIFMLLVSTLSTVANFFIYCYFNTKFRVAVMNFFKCQANKIEPTCTVTPASQGRSTHKVALKPRDP